MGQDRAAGLSAGVTSALRSGCGRMALLEALLVLLISTGSAQMQEQSTKDPGLSLIEAARYALSHHPALASQRAQVEIQRGLKSVASSAFDSVIQASAGQSLTTAAAGDQFGNLGNVSLLTDTLKQTTSSASVSELFRNGISIVPSYQVTRQVDDITFPGGANTATAALIINFPLLRGRGSGAVAAQENAAGQEVTATLLDLDQVISQVLSNIAGSYWRYLAAKRFLTVAIDAEKRGEAYVSNTKALVDADQVPRNDLNEVVANLAQLSALRVAAETAVLSAQQQLALDMGLSAEDMLKGVPDPADDFPNSSQQTIPSNALNSLSYYVDEAMRRRADYLASKLRVREQNTLLVAAKNKLLPQLDFSISGGYAQGRPGTNISQFFIAPAANGLGPVVAGSLTFSFPVQNNAARGAVLQAGGSLKQADVNSQTIARGISQDVVTAVELVRGANLRVEQTASAVASFESSLAGAREKYQLGSGSIIEILTIEDKLTTALNSQIQAQLDYALALAQFRFATGTLVEAGKAGQQQILSTIFTTLPFTSAATTK